MFTTGYGIWGSVNATEADKGRKTTWKFQVKGLEECVPLGLVSPSDGPHLLSAIGDYDGFRHEDIDVSPKDGQYKAPPRFSNSETIAIAARQPSIVARAGNFRQDRTILGAYSLDTGLTWCEFPCIPTHASEFGPVAVSSDGKRIVWSLGQGGSHFTSDLGATWQACNGLDGRMRIVADCVNPNKFYALDTLSGTLLVSTNGAADFIPCDTRIPEAPDYNGGFGGEGGPGATLYPSPLSDGDLWIAMRKEGVYRTTDTGRSFDKIEGVLEAYSIGFGKAAPGKTYPAIFLAGKIDELVAIFRSDDEGKTWLRINDDLHQFGWINHVTGDPRIFGRIYFGTAGRGIIYGDISSE
jgi:hypothetical protein